VRKQELRQSKNVPADAEVAIFVGRLAPEKELPSLVDGFAICAQQNPRAHLIIVGDGPMRTALVNQVRELRIEDRVTFTGMQNTEQISYWLQLSDVFTLVSSREGLPVSLIEAMATAMPSVVTDLPATAQLITEGVHGLRVPVHNPEAIAASLLRLFADPGIRESMGKAARPIAVERFSLDKVLTEYERVFSDILPAAR
jgi:glycosyltransferase involved in cell wall biosynthesis